MSFMSPKLLNQLLTFITLVTGRRRAEAEGVCVGGGGTFRPTVAIPLAPTIRDRGAGVSKGWGSKGRGRKRTLYPPTLKAFTPSSVPTPHVDNYNYERKLNKSERSLHMWV